MDELKHFEDLWNKSEEISQKDISRSTSSQILDELIMKLSLYKSLENRSESFDNENLSKIREVCYGEVLFLLTNLGRAIEAKLQTACSVGELYSIISVHKFEDLIVPKFF